MGWSALALFAIVIVVMLAGYPVAFTLAGVSLAFATLGTLFGFFEPGYLAAMPSRIFGIMNNETLIAVPLFVFMGVMLERSKVAEDLLESLGALFGRLRGGLAYSVMIVGTLLAASTGIVGATVVTMGLLSLPTMLKRGYDPALSAGAICASGTLGQIIPPSIILVLLGDVLSAAYQQAQLRRGIFSPETVSVGDLFVGALVPGLLLVGIYLAYLAAIAFLKPAMAPAFAADPPTGMPLHRSWRLARALVAPLALILAVLGSIIGGIATPTEAAAVGALGAMLLAVMRRELTFDCLRDVMRRTTRISSMVFLVLVGASFFSLVFRGLGGDDLVHHLLSGLPGGTFGAMLVVMLVMFVLDFIEITYVVVPVVGPVLLAMGLDPVWLGVMIAVNLQTSFLTPPFGFALFYLRGVAPPEVPTSKIYLGAMPFVALQLLALGMLALWPGLVTWLPHFVYGR